MARPKALPAPRGQQAGDQPEVFLQDGGDPVTAENQELDESLIASEVGQAAADSVVHVYQIEADGREPKVWRGPPGNFDLEAIARKFGSADYRVMLYAKDAESGMLVRRLNRVVPFKLTPEEDARIKAVREGRVIDGGANAGNQPITAETIAQAIKLALPVPAANNIGQLRELAEVFKIMMPTPVAPAAPALDPLSLLKTVTGVMKDLQPATPIERGDSAGPWDLMLGLVEKFAPLYTKAMEAQAATGAPAPGVAALPAPGAAPVLPGTGPIAAAPKLTDEEEQLFKLKMGLKFLCSQAASDNDPATYASVVLDNVPEKDLEALVAAPDFVEKLAVFEPDVKKHAKWFEELRDEVREEIAERKRVAAEKQPPTV